MVPVLWYLYDIFVLSLGYLYSISVVSSQNQHPWVQKRLVPVLLGGSSWTWPGCDGPASWASTACCQLVIKNIVHCLLQLQGSQAESYILCFLVFYMHIYKYMIWIYCANVYECCCFLILWKVCQVLLWSLFCSPFLSSLVFNFLLLRLIHCCTI